MAATLSSELDNTDKLYELYQDCLDNDLKILPPDINQSDYRFVPIDEHSIRYALGALKGVGRNVVQMIVSERAQNGPFVSFVDFCMRVDKKVINKKTLESLIKAGGFDSLDTNRAKLFHNIAHVLDSIDNIKQNAHQGSLFDNLFEDDGDLSVSQDIKLAEYPSFTLKELLSLEKSAMGYYFSGSLFDEYKDIVHKLDIEPLSKYHLENAEMEEIVNNNGRSRDKTKILMCGIVNYIGYRPLKKGGKMAFVNIEDDSGDIEIVFFAADYEKYKHLLKMDEMLFIEGELTYDSFRNQIKMVAKKVDTLDDAIAQYLDGIELHVDHTFDASVLVPMLGPEGVRLKMNYSNGSAKCRIKLGDGYRFIPNYANISAINQHLGRHGWSIQ